VFEKLDRLNVTQSNNNIDIFYVIKCWNDNIVSYSFKDNNISTEWISLEDKDRERHESEGNFSLRNELNDTEKEIFGCKMDIIEGNRFIVTMNAEQLKNQVNELVMDEDDNPNIIGLVKGKMCRLKYAYAQMKNGLLPEIDYLNLYGESLEDGTLCVEKMTQLN
jgi:hypothetical protein